VKYGYKFVLLALMAMMFLFAGCSSDVYKEVSPNLKQLWKHHPDPWNYDKALAAAEEAREIWDNHPEDIQVARYYVARMQKVDPGLLSIELKRRVRENPSDPHIAMLEAMVNETYSGYISTIRLLYEQYPNDPFIISEYVRVLLGLQTPELETATDLAFKAVELAPDLPLTNGRLAFLLHRVGNNSEAEKFARYAVKLAPSEFIQTQTLYDILNSQNRGNEALELLEEYVRRHPGNADASTMLMKRYREENHWDKMIPVKRNAAEWDAGEGMAWIELAMLYRQVGNHDSTFFYLNKSIDAGFYDDNFFEFAFEEALAELTGDPRYIEVIEHMKETRLATTEERKELALSERLEIAAPELMASDLRGNAVRLSDGRGRVVVLYFWSTWSGWCRLAKPTLDKFYDNTGVETLMVGVNVREQIPSDQRPAALLKYTNADQTQWPIWMADDNAADSFALQVIPTILVIDPDGIIRYQVVGYKPFLDEILQWMVDSINE